MASSLPMLMACGRNQRPKFTGVACACGSEATDMLLGQPICADCQELRVARLMARRDT